MYSCLGELVGELAVSATGAAQDDAALRKSVMAGADHAPVLRIIPSSFRVKLRGRRAWEVAHPQR